MATCIKEQTVYIVPMPHPRPLPDLATLAAQLRLAAMAFAVELADWLGAGWLAAGLRRRLSADLRRLEDFATGLAVLSALRALPTRPAPSSTRRPRSAPRGFAWRAASDNDMRAMRRAFFPFTRDLKRRLRRLDRALADLAATAATLTPRIERAPPMARLCPVAPPTAHFAAQCAAAPGARPDTS